MDREEITDEFERMMDRAWGPGGTGLRLHPRFGITELQAQARRRAQTRRWITWGRHAALLIGAAALLWAGLVLALGYGQ